MKYMCEKDIMYTVFVSCKPVGIIQELEHIFQKS